MPLSVVVPSVAAMTQHTESSSTTSAQSEPVQSNKDTPADVQVAQGDDAEGAVGSAAPPVVAADHRWDGHQNRTRLRTA